jgi:hypothetical protein
VIYTGKNGINNKKDHLKKWSFFVGQKILRGKIDFLKTSEGKKNFW